jgi:hypothetical protein
MSFRYYSSLPRVRDFSGKATGLTEEEIITLVLLSKLSSRN